MATSAILTNNVTIGVYLWAKRKERTNIFTLFHFVASTFIYYTVFRHPVRMRHLPETARVLFSVYLILEWNVTPEREFLWDWKPEWTSISSRDFVNVECKLLVHSLYRAIRIILNHLIQISGLPNVFFLFFFFSS